MAVIQGFLFDLDGTLVDTHESNFMAYQSAIKAVTNITVGSELRNLIKSGESSIDFLPKVVPGVSPDDVDLINAQKRIVYSDFVHYSTQNDSLVGHLKGLSKHYVTGLVTTAKKANALAVLRHYDIEGLFSFKIFGDDVASMKPDPEAYLLAIEKSGLPVEGLLAFEDSEKGIDAAQSARLNVIRIKDFE